MRPIYLALALCAALAPRVAIAADFRRFEDAALHSVQFWDKNEGWAVGDEGTVWHSIDGGQTWERQPTGVSCSLRSLQFLNPYLGWAVGREELPGGGSTGTIPVHARWRPLNAPAATPCPGSMRPLVDAKWLRRDGTDQFPTGVFMTRDAAEPGSRRLVRSLAGWRPTFPTTRPACRRLPEPPGHARTGHRAGRRGRLAPKPARTRGKEGMAVGQGGVILKTDTAGVRWGFVDPKLASEVRACWDFHAVAGCREQRWIVGRPGSVVLHSADQGKTWELQKTGQALALNGVQFIDENTGWAVGEFGCVLNTSDAGKTWKVQRRGGMQSALLFVHARASELPADTLAQLGGADGYLTTGVCVTCPDFASAAPAKAADPQRWQAAIGLAGGAAGESLWQFPLPQHLARADRATLVKHWDRMHGDHAAEQMLRQLVLALRVWKPAVVVTDHPDAAVTGHAVDALVAEAMHEALARAADPKAFPEQIQTLGLEPWQAGKLYSLWDNRTNAQVVYDATQMSPALENTYRAFATPAASLLTERTPPLPSLRFYHFLEGKTEGGAGHKDLMDGTALAWGGSSRREKTEVTEVDPERLKAATRRKTLEALAETSPGGVADPEKLLAMLGSSLAGLSDEQAAVASYGIGCQYARQGQWTLAREIFLFMVDSYPARPRSATPIVGWCA